MTIGQGLNCGFVLVLFVIYTEAAGEQCHVAKIDETGSAKDATGKLCSAIANKDGKLKYDLVDPKYEKCEDFAKSNLVMCSADDVKKYFCCKATTSGICNKPAGAAPSPLLDCKKRKCKKGTVPGGLTDDENADFKGCKVTAVGTTLTFSGSTEACSSDASKFCTTGVENYKCCDDKSLCLDDKIKPTELDACPRNCFVGKGKDAKEETTKTFKSCVVTSDGTTLMYSGLDGECSATATFCKGEIKNYMCCNDKNYCIDKGSLKKEDVKTPCPPPATNPPPPTTPDDSGSGSNLKCSVVLLVVVFARFLI